MKMEGPGGHTLASPPPPQEVEKQYGSFPRYDAAFLVNKWVLKLSSGNESGGKN